MSPERGSRCQPVDERRERIPTRDEAEFEDPAWRRGAQSEASPKVFLMSPGKSEESAPQLTVFAFSVTARGR